jgi:enoyl-CoA hydratase/carnithine racemase
VTPLSLREARERLAAPDAAEAFSPVAGAPFLAVLLAGDGGAVEPAFAEALRALPAPTIAVVPDAAAPAARSCAAYFDAIAVDEAGLETLVRAIEGAPLAAGVLAQLLRGAESRSVADGLVAESLAYSALLAGPEFRAWRASRAPRDHAEPPAPPLRVHRSDTDLRLTLARPAKRNAYGVALRDALAEALALAARDASIARVVLDADGPAFCAGGDLDEFGCAPDPATAHAVRTTRSTARLMAALAPRVEVRVQGACVGAGIELAAFAHRIAARADAWFSLPELAMGLIPGAGGTVSLPRRLGRQRTAWMALTGARVDAPTARAWGLIDAIV